MPRRATELTALAVKKIKKPGLYFLGGVSGFCLKVQKNSASYLVRYKTQTGKTRDCFIGPRNIFSLAEAKAEAIKIRSIIIAGKDPLELKRQQKQPVLDEPEFLSFRKVSELWLKDRDLGGFFRNRIDRGKRVYWFIEKYLYPPLQECSVEAVTPEQLSKIIIPVWETKTNTAKKMITYLRQIFMWAIAMKYRNNKENPADLRGTLGVLLDPKKRKRNSISHFSALPCRQIPKLFVDLMSLNSMSAKACQFAILTAARSQAVRLAEWKEFDLANGIWTIPETHDKVKGSSRDRTVFLSKQAVGLLESLPKFSFTDRVFLSSQLQTMSDMTLNMVLRGLHDNKRRNDGIGWIDEEKSQKLGKPCCITIHGTARSSFRTWAKDDEIGNNRIFDQEAVELCLLHSKNDNYNGAYDRARLLKERRRIMDAWGVYCLSDCEKT